MQVSSSFKLSRQTSESRGLFTNKAMVICPSIFSEL